MMDEVLAALESLDKTSSFYSEHRTKASDFDVKIQKIGALELPLKKEQVEKVIALSKPAKFGWRDETLLDESVRNVWEVPKNKISIGKKQWRAKFEPQLDTIKQTLGLPNKAKLRAEFHSLLIYEEGHFFKPHRDSEKEEGMVATLVIVLPSSYEGGELIIEHQGEKKTFALTKAQKKQFACIAFYADCYHEVKPVQSGYRVTLTYNLMLENYKGDVNTLYESNFHTKLKTAIQHHFATPNEPDFSGYSRPKKLVYLLDHQYTQKGLSWSTLKGEDRTRIDALLAIANEQSLTAHLSLADMKETWDCEHQDYDYYRDYGRYEDDEDEDDENYDEDDYGEEGIPTDIIDTETQLRHWINAKGDAINFPEHSPHSDELCWTGANDGFAPYDSEYEGWMGNYGNTLERWYHRAALILWKAEDDCAIRFSMDMEGFANELFALAKSKSKKNKSKNQAAIRQALKVTAEYWGNYAQSHQDIPYVINTLTLALMADDAKISHALVSAYDITQMCKQTMPHWVALLQYYGVTWGLNAFKAMASASSTKRFQETLALSNVCDVISELLPIPNHEPLVDWLLHYQETILLKQHSSLMPTSRGYARATERAVDAMHDVLMAMRLAQKQNAHVKLVTILMQTPKAYPPLPLITVLDKSLDEEVFAAWGHQSLLSYIHAELTDELEAGLRGKEDWSIIVKPGCQCADCKVLKQFLRSANTKTKIWPLAEHRRSHIESEVEKLNIPVEARTQKVGRPYKLAISKTSELYNVAEKRYLTVQKAKRTLEKNFRLNLLESY